VNLLIIISVNQAKDIYIAAYVANESEAQMKKAEETTACGAAGETENQYLSPLTFFPEEL